DGRVDREDVLGCVQRAVERLAGALPEGAEPEGIVAVAHRANGYTEAQLVGWEEDPPAACERIFPGSQRLVEKYGMNISRKPEVIDLGPGAEAIGYRPQRHFGTFLQELARRDAEGGEAAVRAVRCDY